MILVIPTVLVQDTDTHHKVFKDWESCQDDFNITATKIFLALVKHHQNL